MASSSDARRWTSPSAARPADGEPRAAAVIGTVGAAVAAIASAVGPALILRPNRIVAGTAVTGFELLGAATILVVGLWLLTGAFGLLGPGPRNGLLRSLLGSTAAMILLARAGSVASAHVAAVGTAGRASFGPSAYVVAFGLFLVVYAALGDTTSPLARFVVITAPALGLTALLAHGAIADLAVMREWRLAEETFLRELRRHLFYALGATLGAIALGIPAGVASARNTRVESVVMGVLNLGQVFPALAFVGLMMPILGGLGQNVGLFRALGISGIGWAPVFVVLLVYALFPVTRNTLVAIQELDPAVIDSAHGMGMDRWRTFREVELPLALPVVLAGVRIALVQSTAGAIIAAFVGGGGLGTIMFYGLEQTSMDLVLVGVVPIVGLALFFDLALRGVERLTGGRFEVMSS